MATTLHISSSQEDYLEAIFRLLEEQGTARVRDIADALAVHKSTVTSALKQLADKGLVHYQPYELTTLTAAGRKLGREVFRRHRVLRRFLVELLGASPEVAEANACRMEHAVDPDIVDRLGALLDRQAPAVPAGEGSAP